jgi:hypothetical protein
MGSKVKKESNLTKILLPFGILTAGGTIAYLIFRKKDKISPTTTDTNTNKNLGETFISDIIYLAPRSANNKIINENITEVRLKNENNSLKNGDTIRIEGTEFDGTYNIIDRWTDKNLVKAVMINLKSGLPITGKKYDNAKVYLVAKGSGGGSGKGSGKNTVQTVLDTAGKIVDIGKTGVEIFGGIKGEGGGKGKKFDGGDDLSYKFNY